MSKIDLHIHSIYSDGDNNPAKIYQLIKDKKIKTFSLTDHDEIMGTREMKKIVDKDNSNIMFIPGVELTAKVDHGRMHILGYDFNPDDENMSKVLKDKKELDIYNFMLQKDLLTKQFNISFDNGDIDKILDKVGNIGRVDLALLLIKYGLVSSVKEAFNIYLNPVYESVRDNKKGLSIEECYSLIKNAGGLISWAHPNSYAKDEKELEKCIKYYKSIGLDALECYHIHIDEEYRNILLKLANKYDLLVSGGTDFHGLSVKPDVELGTGINNNVNIDELSIVDHIKLKRLSK